jgi:putative transposase
MVKFIDDNRDELGVEPICTVLQVAPSTYYSAKTRPLSARAIRDAVLKVSLLALWSANYEVYGVRKLWKALARSGEHVGRDQVARLMRDLGIQGARRGRKVRTTKADEKAARPPDLVGRKFVAVRPNALWVTDLTYVATWAGTVYVCFIVDVFSRTIVGWRTATNMRTDMVLDALEMARWSRGTRFVDLVCHSDAGSQGELNWSSQHLDRGGVDDDDARATEAGAVVSRADSLARRSDGCVARGPRQVLGSDRARCEDRRRGRGGARVIPCWVSVVPPRWRREPLPAGDSVGPLSLVP